MTLYEIKQSFLLYFNNNLYPEVQKISALQDSHQNKAKTINKLISNHRNYLAAKIDKSIDVAHQQERLIILQYVVSVVSLEYRHIVWPYEYMALSRRVGELWERFCSAAWDIPSRPQVQRITPPNFSNILTKIKLSLIEKSKEEEREHTKYIMDNLLDLVGEINMIEDEVFSVENQPYIIDFKSGFGSNEKGNMLRLRTVGKAYKLWNSNSKLLFLVRQEQNNNYLQVIKRQGLWEVYCGQDAYSKIEEITGAEMNKIRSQIVSFEDDLSPKFLNDLSAHLSDLSVYLKW